MALNFDPNIMLGLWEQRQRQRQPPDFNQTVSQPIMQGLQLLQQREAQRKQDAMAKMAMALKQRESNYEYGNPLQADELGGVPLNSIMSDSSMPSMGKSSFMPGGEGPVGTGMVQAFRNWQSQGGKNLSGGTMPTVGQPMNPFEQALSAGGAKGREEYLNAYKTLNPQETYSFIGTNEQQRPIFAGSKSTTLKVGNMEGGLKPKPAAGMPGKYTLAGTDKNGNMIMVPITGNREGMGEAKIIPVPGGGQLYPKTDPTMTAESSGRFNMLKQAITEIQGLQGMLFDEQGRLNRTLVVEANFPGGGLPFTEGRTISSMMDNAINAKLRAETGAQANPSEIENISNRFRISVRDSDETAKNKLSRFMTYLTTTVQSIDPRGLRSGGNQMTGMTMPQQPSNPKSVIQNGHTYTFNEATGQYE